MSGWQDLKNIMLGKAVNASPEVIERLAERRGNWVVRLGGTNVDSRRIEAIFNQAQTAEYSWFYTNSPAVRTVVDLLANNIAQLDLRLYDEVDVDAREEQPDHPAMEALRHPNNSMTSDQFVRYAFKSFCLYDNFYAIKVRDNGGPLQFVVLPPERVEVVGRGITPEAYVIHNMDGSQTDPIEAAQVIHWRGENFTDMRIGVSRLETLRAVISEEAAMASAIVELAKSGLQEPTWVYRPLDAPEWSNQARGRFEEDIANRLKRSTSRPPVTEEGMELRGFGVSPRDAEMLAVRKYALQQVAVLYGVPLGMVGLADDVAAAQSEFYSDTLPPLCEAFCRQLNLQVLQAEYSETGMYFEFDLDEKMMGDERLKALTAAAGVPPLLRNEARAKLNYPPVEGGDEPVTPANMIPGSKPAPNVMPIQNPQGPDQGGGAREGDLGVTPQNASLEDVVAKHISRMASRRKFNLALANKELAEDFTEAGLNGDAKLAASAINIAMQEALKNGDRAEVFNRLRMQAPHLAARWNLSLEQLKELKVPEEVLWARAGFSEEEIDRMRALRLVESLTDA